MGWLASLALYKCRAFGPRVEPSWVHPHVCGENGLSISGVNFMPGSSPRVQGKRG